jgi:hypothetical protein
MKRLIAGALSLFIVVESVPVQAAPPAPVFQLALSPRHGSITDTYRPAGSSSRTPDLILIQDLHANRSVQFAISNVLKALKGQGLLPQRIATEGATGPQDLAPMQQYADRDVRRMAADYLVNQGEMPGDMHYVVVEGEGELYGVETEEVYRANLAAYKETYESRTNLLNELDRLARSIPALKKDSNYKQKALVLEKDLEAVQRLLSIQSTPEELKSTLAQSIDSVERVQSVLNKEAASKLIEALSGGANFYALARMRDDDLYENTMVLRKGDRQKTTVLITGGFHTDSIAARAKADGLSYAVITPDLRSHTKTDELLYKNRLLGQHLTEDQIAEGRDWAAMGYLKVWYAANDAVGRFAVAAADIASRKNVSRTLKKVTAVSAVAAVSTVCPNCRTAESEMSEAGPIKLEVIGAKGIAGIFDRNWIPKTIKVFVRTAASVAGFALGLAILQGMTAGPVNGAELSALASLPLSQLEVTSSIQPVLPDSVITKFILSMLALPTALVLWRIKKDLGLGIAEILPTNAHPQKTVKTYGTISFLGGIATTIFVALALDSGANFYRYLQLRVAVAKGQVEPLAVTNLSSQYSEPITASIANGDAVPLSDVEHLSIKWGEEPLKGVSAYFHSKNLKEPKRVDFADPTPGAETTIYLDATELSRELRTSVRIEFRDASGNRVVPAEVDAVSYRKYQQDVRPEKPSGALPQLEIHAYSLAAFTGDVRVQGHKLTIRGPLTPIDQVAGFEFQFRESLELKGAKATLLLFDQSGKQVAELPTSEVSDDSITFRKIGTWNLSKISRIEVVLPEGSRASIPVSMAALKSADANIEIQRQSLPDERPEVKFKLHRHSMGLLAGVLGVSAIGHSAPLTAAQAAAAAYPLGMADLVMGGLIMLALIVGINVFRMYVNVKRDPFAYSGKKTAFWAMLFALALTLAFNFSDVRGWISARAPDPWTTEVSGSIKAGQELNLSNTEVLRIVAPSHVGADFALFADRKGTFRFGPIPAGGVMDIPVSSLQIPKEELSSIGLRPSIQVSGQDWSVDVPQWPGTVSILKIPRGQYQPIAVNDYRVQFESSSRGGGAFTYVQRAQSDFILASDEVRVTIDLVELKDAGYFEVKFDNARRAALRISRQMKQGKAVWEVEPFEGSAVRGADVTASGIRFTETKGRIELIIPAELLRSKDDQPVINSIDVMVSERNDPHLSLTRIDTSIPVKVEVEARKSEPSDKAGEPKGAAVLPAEALPPTQPAVAASPDTARQILLTPDSMSPIRKFAIGLALLLSSFVMGIFGRGSERRRTIKDLKDAFSRSNWSQTASRWTSNVRSVLVIPAYLEKIGLSKKNRLRLHSEHVRQAINLSA